MTLKVGDRVIYVSSVGWLTDIRGDEGTFKFPDGGAHSVVLSDLKTVPSIEFRRNGEDVEWRHPCGGWCSVKRIVPPYLTATEFHALAFLLDPMCCPIAGAKESLDEAVNRVGRVTSEAGRLAVVEEQLKAANKGTARLSTELRTANDRIAELTSELAAAKVGEEQLKSALAELSNHINLANQSVAELRFSPKAADQQNDSLTIKLRDAEKQTASLVTENAVLCRRLEGASEQLVSSSKHIDSLIKEMSRLEAQRTAPKEGSVRDNGWDVTLRVTPCGSAFINKVAKV